MDILASILAELLRQPRHFTDTESAEARAARLGVISLSIDRATKRAACEGEPEICKPIFSDRPTLAALLIAKGKFETGFSELVHTGQCNLMPKGMRCDADRSGVARAHGPWQQWQSSVFPASEWDEMNSATQAATDLAAWNAAKLLAGGTKRCAYLYPDPMASTIAAFSGSCVRMYPGMVAKQAAAAHKIHARLFVTKPTPK